MSSTISNEKHVAKQKKKILLPGDKITDDPGFMRGHGTYLQDDKLIATGIKIYLNYIIILLLLFFSCWFR